MTINLSALGLDERVTEGYAPFNRPGLQPGRVARSESGVCVVLTTAGTTRSSVGGGLLAEAAIDLAALPCVGDWVVIRTWSDRRTTIEVVLPRATTITLVDSDLPREGWSLASGGRPRPSARTGPGRLGVEPGARRFGSGGLSGARRAALPPRECQRPLAANAEVVAVLGPLDRLDLGEVARLLAVARRSGAAPIVVLTKADLAAKRDVSETIAAVSCLATVSSLPDGTVTAGSVPIHVVAARSGEGLEALRPFVQPGRTLGILGRPGSGRSTLLTALAGVPVQGRSPSGDPALIPLPLRGAVIDLPAWAGVASLGAPGSWRSKLS